MGIGRRRVAFFRARAGFADANAQAIIDGLRKLGHFVVPIRASEPGVPDLCVWPRLRPHGVWLELKTAKGKERAAQVAWRERAQARGIRVAVIRTLEEALEALR